MRCGYLAYRSLDSSRLAALAVVENVHRPPFATHRDLTLPFTLHRGGKIPGGPAAVALDRCAPELYRQFSERSLLLGFTQLRGILSGSLTPIPQITRESLN